MLSDISNGFNLQFGCVTNNSQWHITYPITYIASCAISFACQGGVPNISYASSIEATLTAYQGGTTIGWWITLGI